MNTIPVSENILIYIYLILPGFVYLLVLFFLLQAFTNNYLLNFILKNKEFLLYISILVVVFSFAAGYIIHLSTQFIIHLIRPEFLEEAKKLGDVPDIAARKVWMDTYAIFATIRHLFISTLLLGISIWIWLKKRREVKSRYPWKKESRNPFIIYIIILVILILAYYKEKKTFKNWMDYAVEITCEKQTE